MPGKCRENLFPVKKGICLKIFYFMNSKIAGYLNFFMIKHIDVISRGPGFSALSGTNEIRCFTNNLVFTFEFDPTIVMFTIGSTRLKNKRSHNYFATERYVDRCCITRFPVMRKTLNKIFLPVYITENLVF